MLRAQANIALADDFSAQLQVYQCGSDRYFEVFVILRRSFSVSLTVNAASPNFPAHALSARLS
jgi:hypothetical protein